MNQRDLELLSSYLDGQLKPSDSARLEKRLASDPDLRSVLDDLRAARGLLRQLPMRKAPRNFTLTPKMVGKQPPLPRSYPAFRFVTALATLLFVATMSVNFLVPQMASKSLATGMGGGGAPDTYAAQAPEAAATEAAATEVPAAEAPAEQPSVGAAPMPTATPALQDTARAAETAVEKNAAPETGPVLEQAPPVLNAEPPQPEEVPPPVPFGWVALLAGIALLSALVMLLMRRLAAERWRQK